jgi:hypothetical protein
MHPSGVEPEPIAWKAIILPLDHGSLSFKKHTTECHFCILCSKFSQILLFSHLAVASLVRREGGGGGVCGMN